MNIIPGAGTQHAHFNHYVRTGFSIRLSISLNLSFAKQLQGWHAAMAFGSHYHVRVIPKYLGVPLKKGVSLSRAKYVFFSIRISYVHLRFQVTHPYILRRQHSIRRLVHLFDLPSKNRRGFNWLGTSFATQNHKKCV